ncbi:MAG: hypothetical protein WBQ23_06220 [Bacteroidota bacterium]
MKRFYLLLLVLVSTIQGPTLNAQTPQELATAKESLQQDVISLMESRVFPVMKQWKAQFESHLPARELNVLDGLRERHDMIRTNLNNNLRAQKSVWEKHDYAGFTSLRPLLQNGFNERLKVYQDVARFTEKNEKPFKYLETRIDSTVEEWRGSSMRMFVDWFTKYRGVISNAMETPARDELAFLMAACKNIRMEQLDALAKVSFVLWDGDDYTERIRQSGFPESPLTDCGPKREAILLLESATPNPFSTNATIRFFLPTAGQTLVRVVDGNGKTIQRLLHDYLPIGKHIATLQSTEGMSPGTYYVLIESGKMFDAIPVRLSR